jgi:hypothetical protein
LRSFERNGLYESSDQQYGFSDLVALKVLQRLRQDRVPQQRIKASLSALTRKLPGVERPLWELKIVPEGRQVTVELPGGKMDALSGQMLLDFEGSPPAQPLSIGSGAVSSLRSRAPMTTRPSKPTSTRWRSIRRRPARGSTSARCATGAVS